MCGRRGRAATLVSRSLGMLPMRRIGPVGLRKNSVSADQRIKAVRRAAAAAHAVAAFGGALAATIVIASVPQAPTSTRPAPTSRPAATAPTSAPRRVPDEQVRRWARMLGSSDFRARTDAHRRLSELGEEAMPVLVEFIDDRDTEVANRVAALVVVPRDPRLRAKVGAKLLVTGRPEQMQQGAYMLFDDARGTEAFFEEHVRAAAEPDQQVLRTVANELSQWNRITAATERNLERIRAKNPEAADRIWRSHLEGRGLHAEAAYQLALDVLYTRLEEGAREPSPIAERPVTSGPATRPAG